MMRTLTFRNGDVMPALGMGTWKSDPGIVGEAVKTALELGYRHIDCAAIYGNQAEIGAALATALAAGTVSRSDLWITSKLWNNSHGQANVIPALEKTLADLQLDYLDLYLIHWPVPLKPEVGIPSTGSDFVSLAEQPLADTWAGMEAAQAQGLCRHIGVSNFSVAKLQGLQATAQVLPEMNQVELHPYLQQPQMLVFCQAAEILVTAYSPLGSNDRPAFLKSADEPVLLKDPQIAAMVKDRSERIATPACSPAQILLAWALQRGTAVIPKSVNRGRLQENLDAAQLTLTDVEMVTIASLDKHRRYVDGSLWALPGSPFTLETLWDQA